MSAPLELVVECDSAKAVWPALLGINNTQLPMEVKRLFSDLILAWMAQYSDHELLRMVRGKTVGQLINEYGSSPKPKPIDSGEKNGVRWELYDPPANPTD